MTTNIDALERIDGWENAVLGLGGSKDPSVYTSVTARAPLDEATLETLYVEDHFAATIVEKLPQTGLRPGWQLNTPGDPATSAGIRDAYRTREDELGVAQELAQGACWGRLFGGAVTWIGLDDGRDPSLPIDTGAIKSVRFLHTFDRRDVIVWSTYQDPDSPKFRKPETFRISPAAAASISRAFGRSVAGGIEVHESRCVVWGGAPTTDRRRLELSGWDDSMLERCYVALRQASEDYGGKSLVVNRISQAVYKIRDLYAMISGKHEEVLRKRMTLLDASRTRARGIVLDAEKEDFANVAQPLGGLDQLLDKSILRLAAAADMPVTVLMGQSPAGMDATGESDLELWYASVDAWRTLELRWRHERIARLILLSKDGPTGGIEPEKWELGYRALREPKPKEKADTRKVEADTWATYIDTGLASPEEIALHVFSPSSGKTDFALDEADLRAKVERRRALATQPPKDNAELGTVSARTTAILDIVKGVSAGELSRESGLAILTELHRFPGPVAESMLGPASFRAAPAASTPGPAPSPRDGAGAGAPAGLPGLNAGGDPRGGT
jgi:phage-related protein (TIGR01555 family)